MRTFLLICTAMTLASCNRSSSQTQNPRPPIRPQPPLPGPARGKGPPLDSSPIIVSDGSIRIGQKNTLSHFRVLKKGEGFLKLANYEPYIVGYNCDPSPTANGCSPMDPPDPNLTCEATNANNNPCYVYVDPVDPVNAGKTWSLYLCDWSATLPCTKDTAQVTLAWPKGSDLERIEMTTKAGSTFMADSADEGGPGFRYFDPTIQPNAVPHLHYATLEVMGRRATYSFQLTSDANGAGKKDLRIGYICRHSGNNTCGL